VTVQWQGPVCLCHNGKLIDFILFYTLIPFLKFYVFRQGIDIDKGRKSSKKKLFHNEIKIFSAIFSF